MSDALPIRGLHLARDARVIHLSSEEPLAVLSSAVVGAELECARHIINLHVPRGYHHPNPSHDVQAMARGLGIDEPCVGMMTAANLERGQVVVERGAQCTVIAIVTVGLGNTVAAGVTPPALAPSAGTINIIVIVDGCLSRAARVNAVITATEAKSLALIDAGTRAPEGGWASGTSTDSIVIASTERGASFHYAGPVSAVGALIARAVRRGIQGALNSVN